MNEKGHSDEYTECPFFNDSRLKLGDRRVFGKTFYIFRQKSVRIFGREAFPVYVECMWLILQNDKPEDFVIATGEQHSVREFCYLAFKYVGIELEFVGEGENEKGVDKATGKVLVEVSPDFYRPTDVVNLWGDPTKAKTKLGWKPAKTPFGELVRIMVEADVAKVAVERAGEQVKTNLAEYLEKGIVK